MTTAQISKQDKPFTIAPITYEVQREAIAKLAQEYMPLTVESIDDKRGLAVVHDARMNVKNLRLSIERRRKELKAESLEYGKRVDGAARDLTKLLEPIEAHLEHEESIVVRERERLANIAIEQKRSRTIERLGLLRDAGATYLSTDVEDMPQQQFDALLSDKQREKLDRDEKIAAEAAERAKVAEANRIEAEKLAAERAELDRQRKEQEAKAAEAKRIEDERLAGERAELAKQRQEQLAAQAKIDAEHKRVADAKAEQERLAALEKAKEEAATAALLEIERRQEQEEAERRRLEALLPDHEKLMTLAATVESISVPPVSVNAAKAASRIEELLAECVIAIREVANTLTRVGEIA